MIKVAFLLFFVALSTLTVSAQNVTVSLQGSINNFTSKARIFGATLYVLQDDKSLSKSVSDNYGNYFVSAKIDIQTPMEIMVSKPGYVTKKVLFDLSTMKVSKNKEVVIQIVEELVVELYEQKPGVDLSFAKNGYAEKFTWDQPAFIARPDTKKKEDLDEEVKEAYVAAEKTQKTAILIDKAQKELSKNNYQKAISYFDSTLVINPKDSVSFKKRADAIQAWDLVKKQEKDNQDYQNFITNADLAFKTGNWADAELNYNNALGKKAKDSYALSMIQKIKDEKQKEIDANLKKSNYDKALADAVAFVSKNKFDEAIQKYNQAITFQPNQKSYIDGEITKAQQKKSDFSQEEIVKKELKAASDLVTKGQFDQAIQGYKNTEGSVAKFSNQALIDKYSKEIIDGIQKVKDKKNSEDQAYKNQLDKAKEYFLKGRQFYTLAKNTLNSDPMKSKTNEPEVVELREKIAKMEAFYTDKDAAYKSIQQKKNEDAIQRLTKLTNADVFTKKIAISTEKSQIQKSLDSLQALVKPATPVNTNKTANPPALVTNNISAPGEMVTGNKAQAYADMYATTEKRKASPLQQQQDKKDAIEYDHYFNQTLISSRQEEEKNRQLDFANNVETIDRDVKSTNVKIQYTQENKVLKTEVDMQKNNAVALATQEANFQKIDNWKDKADDYNRDIKIDLDAQRELIAKDVDFNKDNTEMKSRFVKASDTQRQYESENRVQNTQYSKYKQDSLSRVDQELRAYQIQKKFDAKDIKGQSPNNLADENGVPFEKGKMTERVYKIKNADGDVISVITRRVVVDKDGYGVVFEQVTNETGTNYYTRNGSPVPDFVWFNESTGENLLNK